MAEDKGEISDGYHTFNELYAHRIELYLALCRVLNKYGPKVVWKSKVHSDGTSFEGWFVLGIGIEKGSQITYHLPNDLWDEIRCIEWERAPDFDGHSSGDVLKRLRRL